MREGEFKENTREESRLIYFICGEEKELKKTKKEVGDSEKRKCRMLFFMNKQLNAHGQPQ